METEKKESVEDRKRRAPETTSQPSSRVLTNSSSSSQSKSPKKELAYSSESVWIPGFATQTRKGHKRSISSSQASEQEDEVWKFEPDDEFQDNIFSNSLLGFWNYYEKQQFTDCIVITPPENTEYKLHKLILSYSSQFFFDAFLNASKSIEISQSRSKIEDQVISAHSDSVEDTKTDSKSDSKTNDSSISESTSSNTKVSLDSSSQIQSPPIVITLPWQDTSEVFPLLLRYMYTGVINLTPQNSVLVSAIAERFMMPKLQNLCKEYIEASLQKENAVEMLLEASKYKAQNLIKRSISNVARNFCHIRAHNVSKLNYEMFAKVLAQEALVITDEYHLYQVVCEYCQNHPKLTKSQILKLMMNVRFRWLTYDQFIEVSSNPLVPKSLLIEAAMARLIPHELSPEEAKVKNASLPSHLQQRQKFSLLFEYIPTQQNLATSSSSASTPSSSLANLISSPSPSISLNSSQPSLSVSPTSSSPIHGLSSSGLLSTGSDSNLSASPVQHPNIFNGIIGWIASNSNREPWRNPHIIGRVKVHSSSLAKGSRSTLVDKTPAEVWTNDNPCSWISIDLGPIRRAKLTYYTLRHGLNYKADSLRTWDLQGSNDGVNWKMIKRHSNDKSLNAPFAIHSWPIQGPTESYRFFRIVQTGHNSSNHNFLALSGFEFYGWLDTHN